MSDAFPWAGGYSAFSFRKGEQVRLDDLYTAQIVHLNHGRWWKHCDPLLIVSDEEWVEITQDVNIELRLEFPKAR